MSIRRAIYILTAAVTVIVTGCIKNDIPYPRIQPNFVTFTVEGQEAGAQIDSATRTVKLTLDESADITDLRITEYTLSPGATVVGDALEGNINLSSPLRVDLHLYADWTWTISATQEIERYFSVEGQVGPSAIDVPGRRVVLSVSKNVPMGQVTIVRAKLGPEGSTTDPALEPGTQIDCTQPFQVTVTAHGREEYWTIYVERSNVSVETVGADGWTNVGWLYGKAEAGRDNGFEYRLKGDEEWTRVPKADVVADGGQFHARVDHLSPQSTYQARAYSDDLQGAIVEFTTGSAPELPNGSLDHWWLDGKVWNPWAEDGEQYWDTGNKGATTLGTSNSMPTDDTSTGTGWAAKLETRFVGIGAIGKLAAGNLFVGRYVRTDGTNGILSFGRPFTDRPTRLRGYVKYTTAPVSSVTAGLEDLKGRPDTCIIWCSLIDQDEPFEIRTNPKNRQLFDPAGSYVVAYGKFESGQNIDSYIPFEITLDYRSTSRVPKYILVTASASKYGDYFTGGNGAVLYVDDLRLEYDY